MIGSLYWGSLTMNDSSGGSSLHTASSGGKLKAYAKKRWRSLSVVALVAIALPFAARGPSAGASQLLGLLHDPFYPAANKAVAAQAVWVIFASAPWSREQIVRDSDGIELWLRLMHLQDASIVERSAAMTYSVVTQTSPETRNRFNTYSRQSEARRLAAAMTLPLCLDRDAFVSSSAAALLINMAALPAARPILLVNHPRLGEELLAALDSKTEGTDRGVASVDSGIIAERASQLAANLASEPVMIARLEESGKLTQWMARLLMRLEFGRVKEQVASTQSGAAQMAVLQAFLSIVGTQGQRSSAALPLSPTASVALSAGRGHNVPGQVIQEVQRRALGGLVGSGNVPQGVWSDLHGMILCGESGTCYSVHHSASADAPSRQQAVFDALADAADGASCTRIASHFAAGLKPGDDESSSNLAALTQTDSLMQVSCYGMQGDGGKESIAWTVSRLDSDWQGSMTDADSALTNAAWLKGSWPRSVSTWRPQVLLTSATAYQAIAAERLSRFWEATLLPVMRPGLQSWRG
ncbi:hypothetical protein WJX73_008569 [Symbiochloris irregularis]|uniref:Uncharacterized protein n=1 Tax=Symbiochloris irregularis TaxID=706552 RepID=A0AAW1NPX9_9CHLO